MKKFLKTLVCIIVASSMIVLSFACTNDKDKDVIDESREYDVSLSISEGTEQQTMNGFGASSAWWSQEVGGQSNANEIAKYLYGSDGMAMNIYRYNIGGGSKEVEAIQYYEADRETESFLKAENYTGTTPAELEAFVSDESNYDFSKDANAQKMLELSYSYGNIDEIILFVNSPHYLMTKNGMTHSTVAKTDNLSPEYYSAFAKYLMVITKYFAVTKGYPVKYISPINEPQWAWGGDEPSQEGCHYEPESCAACLDVVYKELVEFNSANNTSVKLDAFESGNWIVSKSRSKDYIEAMKNYDYFKELDAISVHSYGDPEKVSTREFFNTKIIDVYGINVSISEFCQMKGGIDKSFDTALYLANVMSYDMTYLNAQDWQWWIATSNPTTYCYNDGLVYTDWWDSNNMDIEIAPRSYALSHYSKYVKRGDKAVDVKIYSAKSKLPQTSALKKNYYYEIAEMADDIYNVFKRTDGTIVIVYTNVTDSDYIWRINDSFKSYTAYTSTKDGYLKETSGKYDHFYTFPSKSITTLVLQPK